MKLIEFNFSQNVREYCVSAIRGNCDASEVETAQL